MTKYILTLQCKDQPGIVQALANGIVAADGNILESQQYSDPGSGTFVVRTAFDAPADSDTVHSVIHASLDKFDSTLSVRPEDHRRRALVMVSKYDHCLVDILYRWERGDLLVDLPVVVSNHDDLRETVERAGIPFVHIPVTAATKAEAEAQLLQLIDEYDIDFVVLARYMQVLSDQLCSSLPGRIINIHHSFLPGFKGAKPYHQAHARGVKLIGATAHFVTADLDEGPIIEQEVVRVTHSQTADDLVVIGRDVERRVLSRAVGLHAEDRIVLTGTRAVVFDR